MKQPKPKFCRYCNKQIILTNPLLRFCGDKCKKKFDEAKEKEKKKIAKEKKKISISALSKVADTLWASCIRKV